MFTAVYTGDPGAAAALDAQGLLGRLRAPVDHGLVERVYLGLKDRRSTIREWRSIRFRFALLKVRCDAHTWGHGAHVQMS